VVLAQGLGRLFFTKNQKKAMVFICSSIRVPEGCQVLEFAELGRYLRERMEPKILFSISIKQTLGPGDAHRFTHLRRSLPHFSSFGTFLAAGKDQSFPRTPGSLLAQI